VAEEDHLIGTAELRRRLGNVCKMTVLRWKKQGVLPEPVVINGRYYWRWSEVDAKIKEAKS